MADETYQNLNLFQLGLKGININVAPTHLGPDEITLSQNGEVIPVEGEYALDQRPGMSRINSSNLGSIVAIHDVAVNNISDLTPYLYAGLHSTATHNWRYSSDGTTWVNNDSLTKPCGNITGVGQYKNWQKAVTIGKRIYWIDASFIVHSWDGTTDRSISQVPISSFGGPLATPGVFAVGENGGIASTTYTYKVVAVNGANHSAASAATSYTTGTASLDSSNYIVVAIGRGSVDPLLAIPVPGALTYDVYRTAGGGSTGKVGSIPIVGGLPTTGNGSGLGSGYTFTDGGLTGDGTTAPATASGATAPTLPSAILDIMTDGNNLIVCALDAIVTEPDLPGRLLSFNPVSEAWMQIGSSFSTTSVGHGTASAVALFDGALTYGTYTGTGSGNTTYVFGTGNPLPSGGENIGFTNPASQEVASIAQFKGKLYIGTAAMAAATNSHVYQRVSSTSYTAVLNSPQNEKWNCFTQLYVWNGFLFAGWSTGDGSGQAQIYSSPDGTTWTTENFNSYTDSTMMPMQFCGFGTNLYVVVGKSDAAWNTKTRIFKRTGFGVWSVVDDPTDDFNGALGVVYY